MKLKAFNTALLIALLAVIAPAFAQQTPAAKTQIIILHRAVGINADSAVPPAAPVAPVAPAAITASVVDLQSLASIRREARPQERGATRRVIRITTRDAKTTDPEAPEAVDIPVVAFGFREQPPAGKQPLQDQLIVQANSIEQIKDFSKTYAVDGNDKLQIDNSFGNVTVNTWNKKEIKVDVHIRVTSSEGDVSITDSKKGSLISFKTQIEQRGRSLFGGRRSSNISVDYTVYMPAKNPLEINNSFGAITLPDLDGRVVINSQYGSLLAKSLNSPGNIINVSYGSANIERLRESDLNVEYGSFSILSADKINANASHSSAKIGSISTSGIINTKYGGNLLIGDVAKDLKILTINSDYTNVKLGIGETENANFDVTIHNGNFNYGSRNVYIPNKDSAANKTKWSATQNFKGRVGKGNINKVISINSSYSTVRFD